MKRLLFACGLASFLITGCGSDTTPTAPVAPEPPQPDPPQTTEPPQPDPLQWTVINLVDEFGAVVDRAAISPPVASVRPMQFPYNGTTARIYVACDEAWLRFSASPNLTGGEIEDGYNIYTPTFRVDGIDHQWQVVQSWGGDDLYFVNQGPPLAALLSASTFAVSLSWYGEGAVAFLWKLVGVSNAVGNSCV